jgi:oligopeptide transport system permease protein
MNDVVAVEESITPQPVQHGLWFDAWRRFKRNRAALASLGLLALITLASLVAPALSPYRYDGLDWQHIALPPGFETAHWLGTDRLGRDLLVRTFQGVRISLMVSLLATLISLLIGVAWGAVAGFTGGRVDSVMMRAVDVFYSVPYVFIVIILATLFDRGNLLVLFFAMGAVGWVTMARIVRGQALGLRYREFVEAAVAAGARPRHILLRHIVPNAIGPVIVYATLTIPQMVLYESLLSFLGLGVQEPLASLGSLIREGATEMQSAVWLLLAPAGILAVLLMCLGFIGDGLRDALDPHES